MARHLRYISGLVPIPRTRLDDDIDDADQDDDVDEDDEDPDADEEDDEADEDVETWQVSQVETVPLKVRVCLTSGCELPRLTSICQLC
jgi:hypothetical protein